MASVLMLKLLLFFLLALSFVIGVRAGAQETSPDNPPQDEQPGEETPQEQPGNRLRPVTDAEEEAYKRQAVLEDPFLNAPPGPAAKDLAFYRPVDWLRPQLTYDTSRYLIQDKAGVFQGLLTISLRPEMNADGELAHFSLDCAAPRRRVELWLEPEGLKPRRVTVLAPAASRSSEPVGKAKSKSNPDSVAQPAAADSDERLTRVEYIFDRVTIERDAGVVTTQERMRQLPYSFDIEQLPLLVRQLDFERLDRHWPFEALVTDPEHRRTLQLQIQQPKRVEVTTAEPQTRAVYELQMRLGEADTWTWWIERSAPYRLVKFTTGSHTYLLNHYEPAPGSY